MELYTFSLEGESFGGTPGSTDIFKYRGGDGVVRGTDQFSKYNADFSPPSNVFYGYMTSNLFPNGFTYLAFKGLDGVNNRWFYPDFTGDPRVTRYVSSNPPTGWPTSFRPYIPYILSDGIYMFNGANNVYTGWILDEFI